MPNPPHSRRQASDPVFQTELLETNIFLGRLWRSHRARDIQATGKYGMPANGDLGAHLACAEDTPVLRRVYEVFSAGRLVMRIIENFCAGIPNGPAQSATTG